jgi:hypothetical protein
VKRWERWSNKKGTDAKEPKRLLTTLTVQTNSSEEKNLYNLGFSHRKIERKGGNKSFKNQTNGGKEA